MSASLIIAVGILSCISKNLISVSAQTTIPFEDIGFYLYTPDSPAPMRIPFLEVSTSPIKSGAETFFVIDGFLRNYTDEMSQTVKDGLLKVAPESNVIVVDWGKYSSANSGIEFGGKLLDIFILIETYEYTVKNYVQPIGQLIAAFSENLRILKNIQFSQIHVIGHSLGAHIAGGMGLEVIQKYGGKLRRITALDPAGPSYKNEKNMNKRVDKSDADFVDVYHTNRYGYGDESAGIGHVNLFINGGKGMQPGCENEQNMQQVVCGHWYSWRVWNLSLENVLQGCSCRSSTDCECKTCTRQCSNAIQIGLWLPTSTRGDFYVSTQPSILSPALDRSSNVRPTKIKLPGKRVNKF